MEKLKSDLKKLDKGSLATGVVIGLGIGFVINVVMIYTNE